MTDDPENRLKEICDLENLEERHDLVDLLQEELPVDTITSVKLKKAAADRIKVLEREALEWEARACAMFPYVPDDTKCGTLAWARDAVKARLARAEALEKALQEVLTDIADYERVNNLAPSPGKDHCWQSVAVAIRALKEKK